MKLRILPAFVVFAALLGCVDLSRPLPVPDPADPRDGLVLYWSLDDAPGAPAADESEYGFEGSYLGFSGLPARSTNAAPVMFANPASRQFDGASRHAVLLDPMPTAVNPKVALTMAVWYRATALDPLGAGSELVTLGNNQLLRLRAADIEVSKRVLLPEGWEEHVRCFAPVSNHLDGAWHHVAAVIDAATVRVYFDGVERCLLANDDPMTYDLGNELWVGRHISSASYDFTGHLDEVRIYSRALPAAEVAALAARRAQTAGP
jgi:hypothetical protein